MQDLSQNHFGVSKRVLRYIQGTINYGLLYKSSKEPNLIGYTNSDWASCLDYMKSTLACVFTIGSAI